jgi:hypothetical protein
MVSCTVSAILAKNATSIFVMQEALRIWDVDAGMNLRKEGPEQGSRWGWSKHVRVGSPQ